MNSSMNTISMIPLLSFLGFSSLNLFTFFGTLLSLPPIKSCVEELFYLTTGFVNNFFLCVSVSLLLVSFDASSS